jgi:Kef-type K+ transport system membrane component KefB
MQQSIFSQLSLIIAVGAGVSMVMRLLKQPLIIAYILTGIIVGPSLLHIIRDEESIKVFAEIGIALLLFIIGLGLNIRVVKEVGRVAGLVGFVQVSATVLLGYITSTLLGFGRTESLLIGLGLAFSSTIIILKLIGDKKEHGRLYGKITIGILLMQDIFAMIALIVLTASSGGGLSISSLGLLAAKGIGLTVPLFLIAIYVLPKFRRTIAGSQEFLFLFAIAWGFGAATLYKSMGFSIEIGALIAGVSLASTPYAQEISSRLRPLRDFFVVVFFINLGTTLSFGSISKIWYKVAILSMVVLLLKPLVTMITLGLMRYTKLTSFKTATSLAQVSEFSLVMLILAASKNMVSTETTSVITLVALVTITLSSYFIIYADGIYHKLERFLNIFERRAVKAENEHKTHYQAILFGYKKGGSEFLKTFKNLGKKYIVVDYDPEVIDTLERHEHNYLYGDATDPEFLQEIGLEHSKIVVSTISDYTTNLSLCMYIEKSNPRIVFICSAETAHHASELYNEGADYVMLPHYIGSEKIGAFIKKSGLKKAEFKKFRARHLAYLENHYDDTPAAHKKHLRIGHAVLEKMSSLRQN